MDKYLHIFRLSVIHSLKNYKSLIGLSIFLVTCLIIFSHLWKVLAGKIGAVDLKTDNLLWYIACNEWVFISLPHIHDAMESDLKTGKLAYLLSRPVSYLASVFCEAMGTLCVNLVFLGIVAFSVTRLFSTALPCSVSAFPVLLSIGLVAGALGIIFLMIIGLSAFWLQGVDPFYWLWEKSMFALGGLMLPLAAYPGILQTIAHYTPFPYILGDRSALIINFSAGAALQVLSSLLLWGVLGLGTLIFVYKKGLKIINIEGG